MSPRIVVSSLAIASVLAASAGVLAFVLTPTRPGREEERVRDRHRAEPAPPIAVGRRDAARVRAPSVEAAMGGVPTGATDAAAAAPSGPLEDGGSIDGLAPERALATLAEVTAAIEADPTLLEHRRGELLALLAELEAVLPAWARDPETVDAFRDAVDLLGAIRLPETAGVLERVALEADNPAPFHAVARLDLPEADDVLLRWSGRSVEPTHQGVAQLALLESARPETFDRLYARWDDRASEYPAATRAASFLILARRAREAGERGWLTRLEADLPRLQDTLARPLGPAERARVLAAMAELGTEPATHRVAQLILEAPDHELRRIAAATLLRSPDPRSLEIARRVLADAAGGASEPLARALVERLERDRRDR